MPYFAQYCSVLFSFTQFYLLFYIVFPQLVYLVFIKFDKLYFALFCTICLIIDVFIGKTLFLPLTRAKLNVNVFFTRILSERIACDSHYIDRNLEKSLLFIFQFENVVHGTLKYVTFYQCFKF